MTLVLVDDKQIEDYLAVVSQELEDDEEDGVEDIEQSETADNESQPENQAAQLADPLLEFIMEVDNDDCVIVESNVSPMDRLQTSNLIHPSGRGKLKRKSGRPKDPVQDEFTHVSGKRVQCPKCLKTISNRVDVMKNHKQACKGYPKKPRTIAPAAVAATTESPVGVSAPTSKPSVVVSEPPAASSTNSLPTPKLQGQIAPKRLFQDWDEAPISKKPLRKFLDGITAKEKESIDLQVGKMFFACNIPFRVVENDEMRALLGMLRPSYQLPTKEQLGGPILDRVYEEVEDRLKTVLNDKEVILMQDGWSTSQTQPVIAHSVHCGNEVYFLNAISTGTDSKTSKYCFDLLQDAIKLCENEYKCRVIGVVTDNCNVMTNLRSMIDKNYKDIVAYGCNSHYFNSIGRKVTPSQKIEDIIKVQKYFKLHHFQAAALLQRNGKRPVLPGSTRWNSQQDCLENFIENHTIYLDILRKNPAKFDPIVANIIKNGDVYEDASSILETAKPVAVALDKSQRNTSIVSEAVAEWIQLRSTIKLPQTEEDYLTKTIEEALVPPVIASHILDPRFRGNGLTMSELNTGYEWMRSQDPELATLAVELEAKNEDRFPRHLLTEDMLSSVNPRTFWSVVENRCTFSPSACKIAQRLMKLPASASGIERCFSTMSSILSRNRNKLKIEKASKLCTIYRSLRCLKDD